jgi:hypothetical protein
MPSARSMRIRTRRILNNDRHVDNETRSPAIVLATSAYAQQLNVTRKVKAKSNASLPKPLSCDYWRAVAGSASATMLRSTSLQKRSLKAQGMKRVHSSIRETVESLTMHKSDRLYAGCGLEINGLFKTPKRLRASSRQTHTATSFGKRSRMDRN